MYEFLVVAFLGAAAQELAHWYELRRKFTKRRVAALLRSREYWIVTAGMVLVSPVGCWILFGDADVERPLQFISGAAFPLLLKKGVGAVASVNETSLGHSSLADYFQLHGYGGD